MTLDTRAFDRFIAKQDSFISEYESICAEYVNIVNALHEEWKGDGADAFNEDALKIKTNLSGIKEILHTMCNTLIDSRSIFDECDKSLGSVNRNALE